MKVIEAVSAIAGKYFAVWVILTSVIAFLVPEPFLGLGGYITILLTFSNVIISTLPFLHFTHWFTWLLNQISPHLLSPF